MREIHIREDPLESLMPFVDDVAPVGFPAFQKSCEIVNIVFSLDKTGFTSLVQTEKPEFYTEFVLEFFHDFSDTDFRISCGSSLSEIYQRIESPE